MRPNDWEADYCHSMHFIKEGGGAGGGSKCSGAPLEGDAEYLLIGLKAELGAALWSNQHPSFLPSSDYNTIK